MNITESDITLNCMAKNRDEALTLADYELAKKRCVDAGFLDALIRREKEFSTWIGAGVAMPHINRRDSALVARNGFHILQFPNGVKWDNGHIAFLVVVVAAKDNAHLEILSGLASLLDDERRVERLSVSASVTEFRDIMRS